MPLAFFYGADMFIGWTEFHSHNTVPSEPSNLGPVEKHRPRGRAGHVDHKCGIARSQRWIESVAK